MGEGGHFFFDIYMVSIFPYKLTVLNWGGHHLALVSICALVSIYSYKFTISIGVS